MNDEDAISLFLPSFRSSFLRFLHQICYNFFSLSAAVLQQPDSIDQYGSKLPNGTFTGCLGRIVYKQSDLVAIGFFIKDYLTEELEFTVGIYPDELCCVTKKAQRIPQYLLPTICFQWQVWLLYSSQFPHRL